MLLTAEHKALLREELIQLAAMTVAYIDAIDLEHCGPRCTKSDPDHAGVHLDWTGYTWRHRRDTARGPAMVLVPIGEEPDPYLEAYEADRARQVVRRADRIRLEGGPVPPNASPWHLKRGEELAVPGHDPETCEVCAPARTEAARAGAAAAAKAASSTPD